MAEQPSENKDIPPNDIQNEQKEEPVSNITKELKCILVAGATGACGRHCVNVLVRDPRVAKVIALTRGNERSAEFYGLEEKSDDLSKLEHLTVDYEGDLDKQLDTLKFDAGLSCIGVYTADIKNEKDFFKKEHEPNIKIAKAAALHGAKRWSYLSGMGVKQTTEKKWNQALFSWVKGRVEADLQMIDGFECVSSMRPGWIAGRPRSNNMGKMASLGADIGEYLGPHLIKTKLAVHRDDISTAMVHSILDDSCKESVLICENEEIKEQAQKYRQYLSSNYSTKSPM